MEEEDVAKIVFAEVTKAIERTRREIRDLGLDFEIGFPDTVEINGRFYKLVPFHNQT